MRSLTPGRFETFATVSATEMSTSGDYPHVMPTLTMILQVLQVLKAACTGGARVESARRRSRVSFTDMDPKMDFSFKSAATDGAIKCWDKIYRAAALFQVGEILFLVNPLYMFL